MEKRITGKIKLSLYGKPLELELTVPQKPVKPTRMLPVFQHVTNKFVQAGVNNFLNEGETISCQAGCGACCRQVVPLAEIEVYQIAELVENLPEPRRTSVKQKFAEGYEQLQETEWFERFDNYDNLSKEELSQLSIDYFQHKIACPFLEDDSCSIHPNRPLACREYLVTSDPKYCDNPTVETIKHIPFPAKVSTLTRHIGKTENTELRDVIPMIRSLEWVKTHPDKFKKKSGQQWVADFFNALLKDKSVMSSK